MHKGSNPETESPEPRFETLGRLIESSAAVIFLWRIEPGQWPVETVSAGVERLLGYTPEDLTSGRVSWPGVTHPEDAPRLEREVADFLAQGRDEWSQEYRLFAKDGRTVWVQDWNRVIRDANDKATHVQGLLVDITARKQAEAALRESEARFRLLVEELPNTVTYTAALDEHSTTTYVSPQIEPILGYTRHEHREDPGVWFKCLHPEDRDRVLAEVAECHRTGKALNTEYRMIRKDGRTIWLHDVADIVRDPDGKPLHLLGVNTDISERKQAEADLRCANETLEQRVAERTAALWESEGRLRLAAGAANVGFWDWDLRTNQVYYSPEWKRQLGYRDDDLTNRFDEWEKRVHPDDLKATLKKIRAYLAKPKGQYEVELRLRHKDGSYRWIYALADVQRNARGTTPVRMLGCHIDITSRKEAEAALRESEARYRTLFAQAGDGILLIDPETTGFVAFNDAACRRMGYTRAEYAKLTIPDLEVVQSAAEVKRVCAHIAAGNRVVLEGRQRTKSGELVDIEVRSSPVRLDGKVLLLSIWRDITERRQAEEALRQANEELESKVRERTSKLRALAAALTQAEHNERRRIAYLLHEDLQQRLMAIRYNVHALKGAAEKDSASRTADQVLDQLTEAVELTRNLTLRLLPPVLYELGFSAALDTLADEMKAQRALSVRITGFRDFQLPAYEMRAFAFDAVRELLLNVLKHAGVKCAEIRIRHAGKKRITIEVRDKGKGIAASLEPTGTFGLFSIRERAEAMGVGFDISSRPGKGTSAALTMPIL